MCYQYKKFKKLYSNSNQIKYYKIFNNIIKYYIKPIQIKIESSQVKSNQIKIKLNQLKYK